MRLRFWKDKSPQMAKQLFTFVDFDLKAVVQFERRFRRGVPRHIRWDQIVSPRSCKKIVENQKQSGAGYTPQKCESKSDKYLNICTIIPTSYLCKGNNLLQIDQSVTFVWILTQMNIRIYLCQENDTNEYPNIFVSKL